MMGIHPNISHDRFPEQGEHLGKRVRIYFNYDTSNVVYGICVRDDVQLPGLTLFRGDDGKFYRDTECQYSLLPDKCSKDGKPCRVGINDDVHYRCGTTQCGQHAWTPEKEAIERQRNRSENNPNGHWCHQCGRTRIWAENNCSSARCTERRNEEDALAERTRI